MQRTQQTFCIDVGTLRLCKTSSGMVLIMKFLVDWICLIVEDIS